MHSNVPLDAALHALRAVCACQLPYTRAPLPPFTHPRIPSSSPSRDPPQSSPSSLRRLTTSVLLSKRTSPKATTPNPPRSPSPANSVAAGAADRQGQDQRN